MEEPAGDEEPEPRANPASGPDTERDKELRDAWKRDAKLLKLALEPSPDDPMLFVGMGSVPIEPLIYHSGRLRVELDCKPGENFTHVRFVRILP